MRRRKPEKLMAWVCILAIMIGLVFATGIFDGSFSFDLYEMFTIINALWALIYFTLELQYLRIGGAGVISPAMHMTILVNSTGMAVISLVYLGPMHSVLVGSQYLALLILQYLLPILLIIEYLVGVKNCFRKKQIPYVMGFPLIYDAIALGCGAAGFGFGMEGAKYPYPFINVEQLGWGIVLTNLGMLVVAMYLYCRIWIWFDKKWRRYD